MRDPELRPISELAYINPGRVPIAGGPETSVSFIPMADVSESGEWTNHKVRRLREVSSGYTAFAEGDVLFAKITPCMENGKGAHALGLINGVGFGTTEFHVVRAREGISDSRYLRRGLQQTREGTATSDAAKNGARWTIDSDSGQILEPRRAWTTLAHSGGAQRGAAC